MSKQPVAIVDADPDGQRLPIKLDSTSNGEFAPVPLGESLRQANSQIVKAVVVFAPGWLSISDKWPREENAVNSRDRRNR